MPRTKRGRLGALCLLLSTCLGCSESPELGPCNGPGDPHGLTVTTARDPTGTVTTSGACTPVHCTKQVSLPSNGCGQWQGEMTSANLNDACVVVFVGQAFYDGQTGAFTHTARAVLHAAPWCDGGPQEQAVTF